MTVWEPSKSHSLGGAVGSVPKKPLLWLNALCLDAPLVALSWQWLFARVFHVALQPGESLALFLTAWWIYLADRFADSVSLAPGVRRSARVAFCLRHLKIWGVLLFIVGALDAVVAVRILDRRIVLPGISLGALALVYLAINLAFGRAWRIIPIKEITIGFLFATGTLLVLLPAAWSVYPEFFLAALLFGWLCSLNCLSIAVWERELDEEQGKHSFATSHATAAWPIRLLCLAMALLSFTVSVTLRGAWPVTACLGLSGAFLFALYSGRLARDERTALADLVLLTPLLFLLGERFL